MSFPFLRQPRPCKLLAVSALTLLSGLGEGAVFNPGQAQIVPDDTLGAEGSRLTEANRIEGGAQRGASLFHSFADFNVGEGQSVYFADPVGISDIFSRVTGDNASQILGTLGVDGAANLYFLNPNGIVFGPNAQLDINGAFVASTADELRLGDSFSFSAVNPTVPPLLHITATPGLQYGAIQPGTAIANQGQLITEQDLTLTADNLFLQGELWAGGDVTLAAQDTLQIRDTATRPFIAAAGERLLLQGNQQVDILALNHPDSGLVAGGDLVMRSQQPIISDAHFWNGGTFRVEQLDGALGNLVSIEDPIIRSQGDVRFFGYQGGSLHILASGAVEIGTIIITGPDTAGGSINPITTPELAAVELSNGDTVIIDGSARPTLDIRAGMSRDAIGTPLGTVGADFPQEFIVNADGSLAPFPENTVVATGGNITIGDIQMIAADGLVLLTNNSNPASTTSNNNIVITGEGLLNYGIDAIGVDGDGSTVILDAQGDIVFPGTSISTSSQSASGGDIYLLAHGSLIMDGSDILSEVEASSQGSSGSIYVNSDNVDLSGASRMLTQTVGDGEAGDIVVAASGTVTLTEASLMGSGSSSSHPGGDVLIMANELLLSEQSQIRSNISGQGNGGEIAIKVGAVTITEGGQIGSQTTGQGTGGAIALNADQQIVLANNGTIISQTEGLGRGGEAIIGAGDTLLIDGGGQIASNTLNDGDAGNMAISANQLQISGVSGVVALTDGRGNGGNLSIQVADSIRLEGSEGSRGGDLLIGTFGEGRSGDLLINTRQILVADGGQIASASLGAGAGGTLTINASDSIQVLGEASLEEAEFEHSLIPRSEFVENFRLSSSKITIGVQGTGNAGEELRIDTRQLIIADGAQIGSGSFAEGDGGNLIINAADSVQIIGRSALNSEVPSGLFTQAQGSGDAGDILQINTPRLSVLDGGQISASTTGQGNAGSLRIAASEAVEIVGSPTDGQRDSLIATQTTGFGQAGDVLSITTPNLRISNGRISASSQGSQAASQVDLTADRVRLDAGAVLSQSASGDGGNLNFQISELMLLDNNSRISTSAGTAEAGGNGGNIAINAPTGFLIGVLGSDSDIIAQAFEGSGGNIDIVAEGIYGLVERSAIPGNGTNDIDASSQFGQSGTISINDPTVDPSSASVELPADVLNAADLVDRRCQADAGPGQSSLVITGRGGLPPSPAEVVRSGVEALTDLELDSPGQENHHSTTPPTSTTLPTSPFEQVIEAHTWHRNEAGQVVLMTAQNGSYRMENTTPFSCQESPVDGESSRGMP